MITARIIFNNADFLNEYIEGDEDTIMEYVTKTVTENPYFFCAAIFNADTDQLMYEVYD